MEELESLGLRIDEEEKLRIVSSETELGSLDLSNKIKTMLTGEFWKSSR